MGGDEPCPVQTRPLAHSLCWSSGLQRSPSETLVSLGPPMQPGPAKERTAKSVPARVDARANMGILFFNIEVFMSCSKDRAALEAHQPSGDDPVVGLDKVRPPPRWCRRGDVTVGRSHASVAGEVRHVRLPVVELEVERELLDGHVLEPELVVPRVEMRAEV